MNVTDSPKPHILYVITKASWGGATKYVYDMAVAARDEGYSVTVAYGSSGELSERLLQQNIPVVEIQGMGRDISARGDWQSLRELITIIRKTKPDVVHANSSKAGLVATIAARISGTQKIIFTAHGWAFNESRPIWQKAVLAFLHLITVWCADEVICVSEAIRRDALWMPFCKNKFVVILHGIDMVTVVPKEEARAKLAPTIRQKTWIGTLAELHPTKGLDIGIKAFARIAPDFPDTALILIGEGQERTELTDLIKKLDIENKVHFCGQIQNASTVLSAFDILLFPSRSEALGYALLEAGNASLPVVASRVGGIPEIIQDSISGVLVTSDDVDGFAEALKKLLTNPELAIQFGVKLHARVQENFSKTHMIEKTLALY
jgi:glycosyltransferase involved in cell wall biosynthesis